MAQYRMYFVEKSGRFRWPYDLSAKGDGDARSVAHAAQYACGDVPVAVELWDGARRVPGVSGRPMQAYREYWEQAAGVQADALLRLTQALSNSGTTVARSRRLSEQLKALQSRQSSSGSQ